MWMAYQQSYTLIPGPDTTPILCLQHKHWSTTIWEDNDPGVLMIRHHYQMYKWTLDERVKQYVVIARLQGVTHLGPIRIDHALVTAILEWRR